MRASNSEPSQKSFTLAHAHTVVITRSKKQVSQKHKISHVENPPTFLGRGLPRRFNSSSISRARWKRNGGRMETSPSPIPARQDPMHTAHSSHLLTQGREHKGTEKLCSHPIAV